MGYLFKTQLVPVNKAQGIAAPAGIFAQLGINIATFDFTAQARPTEIAGSVHLTGGFLWQYDGERPVEQGFHVWPEDLKATPGTVAGGAMTAQAYFYAVTYEWTDAQGLLHRSAPSVPLAATITSENSVTLDIPTLRLTEKVGQNPVRIVVYRWSAGQQTYYQTSDVAVPLLNDPAVDSVTFLDKKADADILGDSILYTTGGVVEDLPAPACSAVTLFKSRLWVIDSEDPNLLWFSKQVIEAVPVEMSDLFTLYVPPTTGSQGSTGPSKCLAPLDDKLIIFKANAIYYLVGVGPDNTGANNDFIDPVFITSTVGCANPASIVFMPNGLMFQSDKGIWLLGRDLSTTYIGAPVEAYNSSKVLSAINVPATNQVRFTLDNGLTLMFDYFFGQWGVFKGIPGTSSTIYQGLHTFINSRGEAFQETPGLYLDGSSPVLLQFTTAWIKLAGLQGYQRAYFFYMLGNYLSPHKLDVSVAYDYDANPTQTTVITPDNYNLPYGIDSPYGGGSPYGGVGSIEQWRVFLTTQKCESIQISVKEMFDATLGTVAGAGLTLSGLDVVVGVKKSYKPLAGGRSTT